MVATIRKPTPTTPIKRQRKNVIDNSSQGDTGGLVASTKTGVLDYVTFDINIPTKNDLNCTVGEERRCVCSFRLRETAPQLFEVIPLYVLVVGGGRDLLHGRSERGRSIPGHFRGLITANDAAIAWATAFNETTD